jgi:SSS family solute:Na+ symporter
MYLGGTLCISTFYAAANQFIVQRTLAAKNEWHARMGIVFTDYLKFLIPIIIIVPGLLAPSLFPHLAKADYVFPKLVENLLPAGAVGLVMAGLVAAVMGHTSGAINSVTTIATMDFYVPWKARRGESETKAVRFGQLFGIVTIIVGVICAELLTTHSQKPIFLYLLAAYGYFTPGIATMFLVGILWKRTTTAGALAAGILTIPLSAAIQWRWPSFPFQNRTGVVFWSCIVVCVLVSLITTPKPAEELTGLIWTRDSLSLPAAERAQYRGSRRPFFWWAIITAVVIFFYIRYA